MQPENQHDTGLPQSSPNPQPVPPPQPQPMTPPAPEQQQYAAPAPNQYQQAQAPAQPVQAQHFTHNPAAQPVGPTFGQPQGMGGLPAKKKPVALIAAIIAAGVLLIGGGIYLAYVMFFSGIKLETYSGDTFSLEVPADYTKEVNGDTVTFTETGDEGQASKVVAYYKKFPSAITDTQLKTVKDSFKTQLEGLAKGLGSSKNEVEQFDVKDTTFQGKSGFELTAKFKEDGKDAGSVRLIAVITNTEIFVVGVAAHVSDPGLASKMNDIIDSFKIK